MSYSREIKSKALEKVKNDEKIKDIAKEMGISISTLYKWKREMKEPEKEQKIKESTEKFSEQSKLQSQAVKEITQEVTEENKATRRIRLNKEEKIYIDKAKETSKKIKELIKKRKFYTAEKLAKEYPENKVKES